MGAYLSVPVTEKISSDEGGQCLAYGASSMQGWRVSQEDAHNAIIDFDEKSHLFAVYDGHGGHEVAAYTALKLPDFIKNAESYKKKDDLLPECLKESFLAFDATLVKPEVVNVLKQIAGTKDDDDDDESESEEEVDNLYREATMPLDEVMAKYAENPHLARCMKEKKGVSPFLRAKGIGDGESHSDGSPIKFEMEGESSSSSSSSSSETPPTKEEKDVEGLNCLNGSEPQTSSQINGDEVKHVNGEIIKSSEEDKSKMECDEETNLEKDENKKGEDESNANKENEEECEVENGEVVVNGGEGQELGKGKGKGVKGGKGKALLKNSEVQAIKEAESKEKKRLAAVKAAEIYRRLQEGASEDELSDDDDDDDEDDNFEDGAEEEEEDGEESEEDEDDEEVEEDDPYTEFAMNMKEEPGFDSGCTACLALIRGAELYVANVGDSRIVVCRDGTAIDMSIDHKPEDDLEAGRIIKAGGRVTEDGRVNGGLNLSRAIGDHGYKQNKNFPPEEQMISPLPDVRSMTLTPKDHFMIVACDGIWNSLSSQEACDFVSEKLAENKKISTICEELFDHCLAPDTLGDGTGCDNMTCIIVTFKDIASSAQSCGSVKRTSDEAEIEDLRQDDKKIKIDDK